LNFARNLEHTVIFVVSSFLLSVSAAGGRSTILLHRSLGFRWRMPAAEESKMISSHMNGQLPEMEFNEIDNFLENFDGRSAYDKLNLTFEEGSRDGEILWRLARACYTIANGVPSKNPQRKDYLLKGREYAKKACEMDPNNPMVLKWMAVMTGTAIGYCGMMEKIKQGELFRQFVERALACRPTDYSMLHMRGRYAYSVATLSWIERKAAMTLFNIPKTANMDEALKDFYEVENLQMQMARTDLRIQNLLYLARCQLAFNQTTEAISTLELATTIEPVDEVEREALDDVKALLIKRSSIA